jgi:hypothetical protein
MCVLGCDALIFLDNDRPVVVEGHDPYLGTKTYATISGGLAYNGPKTGKVYHLVINQAIIRSSTMSLTTLISCQIVLKYMI